MKERIKELYDQADKFAKENRTQTISGPGNNYFELFHEKFAELIVADCASQMVQANMSNPAYARAMDEYYENKWAHRFD